MRTPIKNTAGKSAKRVALATAVLLLLPFVAMQITEEVAWDLADFAVAGTLLFGAGLTYEFASRKTAGNIAYQVAVGVAVVASLLLVWVNLAVGLIGTEDNLANLMYFAVIALGYRSEHRPRSVQFVAVLRKPGLGISGTNVGAGFIPAPTKMKP